jgi:hypothetical protein
MHYFLYINEGFIADARDVRGVIVLPHYSSEAPPARMGARRRP